MTFQASLHRHMRKRGLSRRMALLRTARQKLMAAAARSTGQRADAIADLAAYCDIIAAYLWPMWRNA
jgi:hypothetical protein